MEGEEGKVDPAPELWPVLDLGHLLELPVWVSPTEIGGARLSVLGVTKGSYDDQRLESDFQRKQSAAL